MVCERPVVVGRVNEVIEEIICIDGIPAVIVDNSDSNCLERSSRPTRYLGKL